jgi:hypothetical protein
MIFISDAKLNALINNQIDSRLTDIYQFKSQVTDSITALEEQMQVLHKTLKSIETSTKIENKDNKKILSEIKTLQNKQQDMEGADGKLFKEYTELKKRLDDRVETINYKADRHVKLLTDRLNTFTGQINQLTNDKPYHTAMLELQSQGMHERKQLNDLGATLKTSINEHYERIVDCQTLRRLCQLEFDMNLLMKNNQRRQDDTPRKTNKAASKR